MVGHKMFLTGIGSRYEGEAFGDPYELPPDQCYCETWAIAALWNWRMLLITGEDVCGSDRAYPLQRRDKRRRWMARITFI
jgi:DUF1680 family protein